MRRRDGLDLGEMVYRGRVLAVAFARFSAIHLSKKTSRGCSFAISIRRTLRSADEQPPLRDDRGLRLWADRGYRVYL